MLEGNYLHLAFLIFCHNTRKYYNGIGITRVIDNCKGARAGLEIVNVFVANFNKREIHIHEKRDQGGLLRCPFRTPPFPEVQGTERQHGQAVHRLGNIAS